MKQRKLTYFASDVHLGLLAGDPVDRESRFVHFLKSIPTEETESLYLLGDIWDFWYEYRDVVPKGYVRVFAAIMDLIDKGVNVFFFPGNHDIWCYNYFEELGMIKLHQPVFVTIGNKKFCLGHGDGLGPGHMWYKFMRWCFYRKTLQRLFSMLHPWFAFRLGQGWSKKSRVTRWKREKNRKKSGKKNFRMEDSPLLVFAKDQLLERDIDYFIFGHYHRLVDIKLPKAEHYSELGERSNLGRVSHERGASEHEVTACDSRFCVLKDWINQDSFLVFDSLEGTLTWGGYSQNKE